jgi:hypothetical protein
MGPVANAVAVGAVLSNEGARIDAAVEDTQGVEADEAVASGAGD